MPLHVAFMPISRAVLVSDSWRLVVPLLLAATFGFAPPAAALVVDGTQAVFGWDAAPGPVVDYGVWILSGEETPTGAPSARVAGTQASLEAAFGDRVRVSVAAFYPGGVQGPHSEPSEWIHFREPGAAPFDLDGSGTVDVVVFDARAVELRALLLDLDGVRAEASLPAATGMEVAALSEWTLSGSADFDRDGSADLLLVHVPSGLAEIWSMQGTVVRGRRPLGTLGPGWFARALGDTEPGGAARVLWHDESSGRAELWHVAGGQLAEQIPLGVMEGEWTVWATCDIDGNGFRDVLWMDPLQQEARAWRMAASGEVTEEELEHPGDGYVIAACGALEDPHRDTLVWQKKAAVAYWNYAGSDGGQASGDWIVRKDARGQRYVGQAGDGDGDGDADLVSLDLKGELVVWQREGGAIAQRLGHSLGRRGEWGIASW